jgi:hypothetical protein
MHSTANASSVYSMALRFKSQRLKILKRSEGEEEEEDEEEEEEGDL